MLELSHVRGATDVPLSTATVYGLLAQTAQRFPDRDAIVFREPGVRWTWREFLAEVDALAAGLGSLGIARGDRVGIWSPNRPEWLITQYATAKIGAILLNVNPAYRVAELEYALSVSGCRAIVTAEALRSSDYIGMLQAVRSKLPALEFIVRMGQAKAEGMINFAELMATGRKAPATPEAANDCHDPINIQFTSGTTGNPKGATLTHHNIINNARFVAQAMRFSRSRRAVRAGAALSLLRHGDVLAGLRGHRREDGVPGRSVRPRQHAGDRRRGRLHRAARRADDVHRRARPARLRAPRPEPPAHRHHGRRALPDRDDEPGGLADEHARGHHRLRHDRDLAGLVPELDRRSARQARDHRRARAASPRGQAGRCRGQHGARRRRPASCARAAIR